MGGHIKNALTPGIHWGKAFDDKSSWSPFGGSGGSGNGGGDRNRHKYHGPTAPIPPHGEPGSVPTPGGPFGGISPRNLSEWQAAMSQRPGPPRPAMPVPSPGHSRSGDMVKAGDAIDAWDRQFGGQLDAAGNRLQPFMPAIQPPVTPPVTQAPLPPMPGIPRPGAQPPPGYGSRLAPSPQMAQGMQSAQAGALRDMAGQQAANPMAGQQAGDRAWTEQAASPLRTGIPSQPTGYQAQ